MDELLKAIKANDLTAFIQAVSSLMLIQPPKGEDTPALSDQAMIDAIMARKDLALATHAIVSGIGKFLEDRGYLSEKQRAVIVSTYNQHIKPYIRPD